MQKQEEKAIISYSLTSVLAIAFLALSVAVLLIASSFEIYLNFQTQREFVAGKQQLIARDAANTVASFIYEKFSVLEAAIKLGNPVSASRKDRQKVLQILLGLQPAFRHLVLLDSQAEELAKASRLSQAVSGKLIDRVEHDLFSQTQRGKRYIGSVYVDEVTSEPLVIMAVPVTNIFGDFQGTLMAEVNLKFMWDLVDRLKIGETGLSYVVDRQGNLIAFGDIARVLRGENMSHLREVREFIDAPVSAHGTGPHRSSGINGTSIIGTYVPLGMPDWALVTELPVREAYREVIRGALMSAGVILVMAILAGLLGFYVARRLAVPLLSLTETATRIAGGEMGLQAAVEGPTEVVSLAGAFNNMTGQLREMLHKEEERTRKLQQEIVQRRHAEEALRESEAKYRRLHKSMRDAFVNVDMTGRIQETNRAYQAMLGYSEEDLRQLTYINLTPEKWHSFEAGIVKEQILVQGYSEVYEKEYCKKDGTIFPAELRRFLIRNNAGEPVGMWAIVRDITERKRAEEELIRLATAIDQVSESVIIADKTGTIRYINPAFEQLSGFTQGEITGQNFRILKSDKHDEEFYRVMWSVISVGKVWAGRIINRMKDGTFCEFETRISPIRDSSEGIVSFVSVNRDITQEVELEAKLYRAQKMEALGLLAGGVAHDLNNVLAGVVSYPDLMLIDLPENSPLRKPILTIQDSGKKAAAIVQDLLTLARRGVTITEILNLNEIILNYLKSPEFLRLTKYHSDVQIVTSLDADLLNIKGSSVHLIKTIMNLVSNAAEAQPAGGKITISTSNQYLDMPLRGYEDIREGDFVVLEVADNGTGIATEDLDRVFEPFYTKKEMGRSGTGLGMAVVWGTVQDHYGYINIKSTEGEGTTIYLYFPVTREKTKRDKDLIPIETYMGQRQTILVVDDVKEQREIATSILGKLNYSVTTVPSGEEAENYMKNNTADLLVLDMIMAPGIDGLETYKRILELHPGQKAIIASGYSETDNVKEVRRLGAGQYIRKPYTLEKIGLAVKAELGK